MLQQRQGGNNQAINAYQISLASLDTMWNVQSTIVQYILRTTQLRLRMLCNA